jgi:hypothetical protein
VLAAGAGHLLPSIGLGVYQAASGGECYAAVASALRLGYRHVDTAQVYNNEADVGRALADSGLPREQVGSSCQPGSRNASASPDDSCQTRPPCVWRRALSFPDPCASSLPRQALPVAQVFVTTKVWTSNWGYDKARASIRQASVSWAVLLPVCVCVVCVWGVWGWGGGGMGGILSVQGLFGCKLVFR